MSDTGYYVGVISGTSVDAIDCALIETTPSHTKLLATCSGKYPDKLRSDILSLCDTASISLQDLGTLDNRIARAFADTINELMAQSNFTASQISAIGSHGQTVFHQPAGDHRFSMQLGDPNIMAELTGVTTVGDFRRRDMAAGGQGAPLAPLFHQHFFYSAEHRRCVVNIGGMSNITLLNPAHEATPRGYDTGPGNVLMDTWIQQERGARFDEAGNWAASGEVDETLLRLLLDEPYFSVPPPKSTGRELFNLAWLQNKLAAVSHSVRAADVQRTLLELTALSISRALDDVTTELIVCGGGAYNAALMQRLQQLTPTCRVQPSDACGLSADWVEAVTFAWLAHRALNRQTVDSRDLTGASHPVILGGIYYA
ncbi:anhydro-N-acetylmuramic acid kinase [Pseudohongiella sp.]|uniref:Anhydro-N-acetylmuramic acid kinase n=1 Tax=marine sediment metagenome TaxID=412755 RepID=A0A0F9VPM8_9ZZZZ|nr:anhydro-N-acetylmuramic acid kinase [Pseudohongiella sp.]HDZ10274.1 anhydro-N-acetylmuramic acid kinase [Pseudohongiella sp.]HEA64254.1 anhydro-N-acetylmuramic acid kinase [Pseudohongiella sp.]